MLKLVDLPIRLIVPVTEKTIVSESSELPARHSPVVAPDAALLLAAKIASRKVHKPSVPLARSAVLLTVMVLASGVIPPLSGRNGPVETERTVA